MAGFSDAEANAFLNAYFRAASYSFPSSLWWALSTTTISDAGGNVTEPSGNGYSRLQIVHNTSNWTASSGRQLTNALDFIYPDATGPWGAIVDFAGMSTSTGGVVKVFGTLVNPVSITAPQTPTLYAGTMIIRSIAA